MSQDKILRVEETTAHNRKMIRDHISDEAIKIAEKNGSVTADDLHEMRGVGDRRINGSALASLVRRGYLIRTGYINSRRKACKARPIALFERTTKPYSGIKSVRGNEKDQWDGSGEQLRFGD